MADWFKFKNDGLDSKGMQFAIGEQPLVVGVWLVILSEASKNRSSKISWNDQDFELIGYARKVNVSVPVFNQCVGLLERIGYIKRGGGVISIPGWEEFQSNYAKGLDKGYYKNTNKLLVSDSQVSTTRGEERRGEEIIGEEKRVVGLDSVASLPAAPKASARMVKPTREQLELQAAKIGLPIQEVDKFINHYESNGWRVGKNPMKSWSHALGNWKGNLATYSAMPNAEPQKARPTVFNLKTIIEAKIEQANALKARWAVETGLDTTWSSEAARADYSAIKREVSKLKSQLAGMG